MSLIYINNSGSVFIYRNKFFFFNRKQIMQKVRVKEENLTVHVVLHVLVPCYFYLCCHLNIA